MLAKAEHFLRKAHVKQYTRATSTGQAVVVREHDDKRVSARPDPSRRRLAVHPTGKIVPARPTIDPKGRITPAVGGAGKQPPRSPAPATRPGSVDRGAPNHRYMTLHQGGPGTPGTSVRVVPHPEQPGRWQIHAEDRAHAHQALASDGASPAKQPQAEPSEANQAAAAPEQGARAADVIARPSSAYKPAAPDGLDTEARFKVGDAYTPERQELHSAIIETLAHGVPKSSAPTFYMTGGGPASGKGDLLKRGLMTMPDKHVLIDADEVKKHIPEYREMTAEKAHNAASFAHEESAHVSGLAIAHAAENGLDAVYDSVGDSGVEKLAGKVKQMKAGGHRVVAHYVTVDTDEAVRRANSRGEKTGRFVPEAFIRSAHAQVSKILPEAIKQGLFDEVTLWDTNEGTPRKVVTAKGSELTVHDDALWKSFLAKGEQ